MAGGHGEQRQRVPARQERVGDAAIGCDELQQPAPVGLPFAVPAKATLADGSVVNLNSYWVDLLWEGQPRRIVALEADGGPLIGMSLLYGSRVTLDVVDGGPVTIVPLP